MQVANRHNPNLLRPDKSHTCAEDRQTSGNPEELERLFDRDCLDPTFCVRGAEDSKDPGFYLIKEMGSDRLD